MSEKSRVYFLRMGITIAARCSGVINDGGDKQEEVWTIVKGKARGESYGQGESVFLFSYLSFPVHLSEVIHIDSHFLQSTYVYVISN